MTIDPLALATAAFAGVYQSRVGCGSLPHFKSAFSRNGQTTPTPKPVSWSSVQMPDEPPGL